MATTLTDIELLYQEWQFSLLRGRPDRYARQKAYLDAKAELAAKSPNSMLTTRHARCKVRI